jgi:hypothetical protein
MKMCFTARCSDLVGDLQILCQEVVSRTKNQQVQLISTFQNRKKYHLHILAPPTPWSPSPRATHLLHPLLREESLQPSRGLQGCGHQQGPSHTEVQAVADFGAVAGRTWTVGATTTGGPKHDVLQIPQEFHAVDLVLREELLKKYGHKLEGTTTRTWNSAAILQRERAGKHLRTCPLSWLAAGGVHNIS